MPVLKNIAAVFAIALASLATVPAAAQITTISVNGQTFEVQPGMQQTVTIAPDGSVTTRTVQIAAASMPQQPRIAYPAIDAGYEPRPQAAPGIAYATASQQRSGSEDDSTFGSGQVLRIRRDRFSGHFIVPVVINGVKVRAIIDTGASGTILSPEDAAATGADRDVMYARPGVGIGGATTLYATRVRSLEIGGQHMKAFSADIGQQGIPQTLQGQPEIAKLGRVVIEDGVMTIYPKGVAIASR